MKRLVFFLCSAIVCLFPARQIQAQTQVQAQQQEDIERYAERYTRTAGADASLFVGLIQTQLAGNIESMYLRDRGYVERDSFGEEIFPQPVHPLDSYAVGDVFYDGVLYIGVRMRLDLHRDEMIAAPPGNSHFGVRLAPERFGYADLRGYRIIYISVPSSPDDLSEGYYLQIKEGRAGVLKKEHFEFNTTSYEFSHRSIKYYVEKDGVYHRVKRSKGSLLRLLRDRRSELNGYIRSNNLDMRRNTESVLPMIVSEYERLTDR